MKGKDVAEPGPTGIGSPGSLWIGNHHTHLSIYYIIGIRDKYGIIVALAHLPPVYAQYFGLLCEEHLRQGKDIRVEVVEPPGYLPC